jgi:hypothetical protein
MTNDLPALGPPPRGWSLGQLSTKYETAGRGPGTVSSGRGDAGGVSYGSYQMTSKPNGGTVAAFIADSSATVWRSRFGTHAPGSREFTAVWQEVAHTTPLAFQAAQHDYIKSTHYDPLVASARRHGVEVIGRSAALKDVIWSTSVQNGPRTPVVRRAIEAVRASHGNLDDDAVLIHAIYAERGRKAANGSLIYFHRNSAAVQKGVSKRFVHEEHDALKLLAAQRSTASPTPRVPAPPLGMPGTRGLPDIDPFRYA